MIKKTIIISLVGLGLLACSKPKGCTDSNATNYDLIAEVNEGCLYPSEYEIVGEYSGRFIYYSDEDFSNQLREINVNLSLTAKDKNYTLSEGSGLVWKLDDLYTLSNGANTVMNTLDLNYGGNLYEGFDKAYKVGSVQYSGRYETSTKDLRLYFEVTDQSSGNKEYLKIYVTKK